MPLSFFGLVPSYARYFCLFSSRSLETSQVKLLPVARLRLRKVGTQSSRTGHFPVVLEPRCKHPSLPSVSRPTALTPVDGHDPVPHMAARSLHGLQGHSWGVIPGFKAKGRNGCSVFRCFAAGGDTCGLGLSDLKAGDFPGHYKKEESHP